MQLSEVKKNKLSAKLQTRFVNQAVVRNEHKRIKLDQDCIEFSSD